MNRCPRCKADWSRGDRDEPAYPCHCTEVPEDEDDECYARAVARARNNDFEDYGGRDVS